MDARTEGPETMRPLSLPGAPDALFMKEGRVSQRQEAYFPSCLIGHEQVTCSESSPITNKGAPGGPQWLGLDLIPASRWAGGSLTRSEPWG